MCVGFVASGYLQNVFSSHYIRDGEMSIVDVQFVPPATCMTGTVRAAKGGERLAGVRITCISSTNDRADATWDATTGPDASFCMSLGSQPLIFEFACPGYVPIRRTFDQGNRERDLCVLLSRGGSVRIVVTSSQHQPLSNCWVMLCGDYHNSFPLRASLAQVYAGMTDAEGTVLLTNVPSHLPCLEAEVFDSH